MAAAATASTTAAATTKAPAPKAKPAAATKAHQHRHATAAASSTASTSRKQRVAITTPFSTAKPTKQERVRNDALERVIRWVSRRTTIEPPTYLTNFTHSHAHREAEVFTDDSEQSRRELVLGTLSTIVQQFVKQVGLQQVLSHSTREPLKLPTRHTTTTGLGRTSCQARMWSPGHLWLLSPWCPHCGVRH